MATRTREKRTKAVANRWTFTELALARLRPPKEGQEVHWDTGTKGQLGLSVLVSSGGTKTYRSHWRINGIPGARKLGRIGELTLTDARKMTAADRGMATKEEPEDPGLLAKRRKQQAHDAAVRAKTDTFEAVVDHFIKSYAMPRQRSWEETERVLKSSCKDWLAKPIASITKNDAYKLLDGFIADGNPRKATLALSWLQPLWKWAWKRDYVTEPVMDKVEIHVEKGERDRVYTDGELRAIWRAADKLGTVEGAYVKLVMLLAPRKTALAEMRRSHLNDLDNPTLWTTPHELTKTKKTAKKKRVYLTPLPALAQRIIKPLLKVDGAEPENFVFPAQRNRKTGRLYPGTPLKKALVKHGAPKDFGLHACRHTIATWLQNEGHSKWERGLVLNHADTGVTEDYSHGYPLDLKRKLLAKWSDHVEGLMTAEGVALLR
ncbi:MAG TPA: integrase family protein [Vineibacter sp.]|nr:integrase family protein [Vineibacter sp.]